MEQYEVFTYQYSAKQNKEVERIRNKYLPMQENKLDALRKLDYRVQTAGVIPSLTLGIAGCLIFGVGMCFGLDVFAGANWLTLLFAALGVFTMLPAYPLYRYLARKAKRALTPEILRLSEDIMNSENNQD